MSSADPVALCDVLTAAAGVLQELEGRCARLQHALSPALAGMPCDTALQDLDYVTQGLASLSYFLSGVAEGLPPDLSVDAAAAAQDLPLSEMAATLRLASREAGAAAGELELFE